MRLLLGGLIVAAMAVPLAAQSTSPVRDLSHAEISIESRSSWCIGCPEWKVTFRGVGTAALECFSGCAIPGSQSVLYPVAQFNELLKALDDAAFFDTPRVVGGCLDCGTLIVTYRDQRRVHEVVDTGSAKLPKLASLHSRLLDAEKVFEPYIMPSAANYTKLLAMGRDPNAPLGPNGETMLNYAVTGLDAAAVDLLLRRGARVNSLALDNASELPILKLLWPAARLKADSAQALSLLVTAAGGNWTQNLTWLIDRGVAVNGVDARTGLTPLMAAARGGYADLVFLLLKRGARPDAHDAFGNDALWYGAERESMPSVIKILLGVGLAVDRVNVDGRTPLMHAAASCSSDAVRELLEAGADRNRKDKAGKTALDLVPPGDGWRVEHCQSARTALAAK